MTIKVPCGQKSGCVTVPASKSWAHRMLITAALSENGCDIICDGISKDISATVKCLNALGANISMPNGDGHNTIIKVKPVVKTFDHSGNSAMYAHLPCGESGSTLRFMIPIAGALGIDAAFHMEGRLSERPLGPLTEVLSEHGMSFIKDGQILYCRGQLKGGNFDIPGNISSQYISGLLMALPILHENSTLYVTGTVESGDYIEMTVRAVEAADIRFDRQGYLFNISGNQKYRVAGKLTVEKDWSSAAFPLCMGAFSKEGMTVTGLNLDSVQGDKEIVNILDKFGAEINIYFSENNMEEGIQSELYSGITLAEYRSLAEKDKEIKGKLAAITVRRGKLEGQIIDASRIPDLVPVISVVAAGAIGETRIIHAERLRIKESDRLATTTAMLKALGADIEETEDGLLIHGKNALSGGTVDSFNDHRIAMSAAVAAGICSSEVTVNGAECTDKSFPGFWDVIDSLHA